MTVPPSLPATSNAADAVTQCKEKQRVVVAERIHTGRGLKDLRAATLVARIEAAIGAIRVDPAIT